MADSLSQVVYTGALGGLVYSEGKRGGLPPHYHIAAKEGANMAVPITVQKLRLMPAWHAARIKFLKQ